MLDHLTREQIAELLDDPAGVPGAAGHLAGCPECAREYEQMSRLRMALSGLPDLEPPPGEWDRVSRELGLDSLQGSIFTPVWRKAMSWPLQAAAVVALFAAGILVGQRIGMDDRAVDATRVADQAGDAEATPPGEMPLDTDPQQAYLRTVADLQALRDGQFEAEGGRESPEAIAERITHLDAMIQASQEALERAPADPVLNNFLFQMVDEREMLAGELNQTLRMTSAEY